MKTPYEIATELFNEHYMVLFDSDTDKGEEILVSLLAIKSAKITVKEMLRVTKNQYKEFYEKVLMELNKM